MEFGFAGVAPADLVDLYRKRALSDREYQVAIEWATRPPARERWAAYLRDWFLVFGVLLVVAGVIMFGAYNWQSLHRFQKLGILELLVLGAWVGSRSRPPESKESTVLLWGACLLVGALLAVFGQVYQSGADAYTLFLGWTLLILPWSLAGRSNLIWLTEALLLNLTIFLYWSQAQSNALPAYTVVSLVLNVGLAAAWEQARSRREWMALETTDTLIALALFPATVAACLAPWEGEFALSFLATLILLGALVFRYGGEVRKMALVAASAIALASSVMIDLLVDMESLGFLLIAFGLIAEVTVAARWLKSINDRPAQDTSEVSGVSEAPSRKSRPTVIEVLAQNGLLEESPGPGERRFERAVPRYVSCLTAFGAWLSSWFFLAFLGISIFRDGASSTVVGLLLWGGTLMARRNLEGRSEFLIYGCLAVNLAGQLAAMIGMADIWYSDARGMAGTALVLQTIGLIWYKDSLGRGLFAFFSVISGAFLFGGEHDAAGVSVWLFLVALAISSLLMRQRGWLLSRWRYWHGAVTFGWSCGLLVMLAVWAVRDPWLWEPDGSLAWLMTGGMTLLTAAAALRLQAPLSAVLALLVLGAATFNMPGLMAACLLFVLAFHTRSGAISGLALVGLMIYGVLYYYNLDIDLLSKSISLIAGGALLLLARSSLRSREARSAF